MEKQWSASEAEDGARNVTEINECCTKSNKQRFNCAHPPFFSTIPISHVVPDIPHLFLGVTDVLLNLAVYNRWTGLVDWTIGLTYLHSSVMMSSTP